MNGRIKAYIPARYFGFVTADVDGAEIFFHLNQVTDPDYFPRRGDRVSFTLSKDRQDRPTAKNVKLIAEGPKAAVEPVVPPDHVRDME